jgi:hypothetical protein
MRMPSSGKGNPITPRTKRTKRPRYGKWWINRVVSSITLVKLLLYG